MLSKVHKLIFIFVALMLASCSTGASNKEFAWNYLANQNSGGVVITIARVVIAEKDTLPKDLKDQFNLIPILDNKPIIGEVIFTVENNTASIISVYPDQALVVTNGEQVDLLNYAMSGLYVDGSNFSGEVFPGVKLVGGVWFGLERSTLDEITSMTIYIKGPHDQNFQTIGPDYTFVLDLTKNREFAPYPEELP